MFPTEIVYIPIFVFEFKKDDETIKIDEDPRTFRDPVGLREMF